MSADRRQIERWIGAVLVPEVRVAGTWPGVPETIPSREYLERFPPAALVAFGRTPQGACSPTKLIEHVRALCRELGHAEPLVACDLEQGAGLHFEGATRLPPALALASAALSDEGNGLDWIERAGLLTGFEACERGVQLVLAPVADVNTQHANPIIAVRSFGDDPHAAGERASAFARGLRASGAGACAKHFPGHGDTAQDSHLVLPRVDRDAAGLRAIELAPFRALIAANVDTVMVAHLDVPALTGEPGLPCTLSQAAIAGCLRGELGFRGAVLSDALNMGALQGIAELHARALSAGCDGLLCPASPMAAADELVRAVAAERVPLSRLRDAAERMHFLRTRLTASHANSPRFDDRGRREFANALALRALRTSPARWPWRRGETCRVLDAWPSTERPEIVAGVERLRELTRHAFETPSEALPRRVLIPVVCEARAGGGKYGPTPSELAQLARELEQRKREGELVALAWFGSPQSLPLGWWSADTTALVLAFAPTPPLFEAVARYLAGASLATGSLPTELG